MSSVDPETPDIPSVYLSRVFKKRFLLSHPFSSNLLNFSSSEVIPSNDLPCCSAVSTSNFLNLSRDTPAPLRCFSIFCQGEPKTPSSNLFLAPDIVSTTLPKALETLVQRFLASSKSPIIISQV